MLLLAIALSAAVSGKVTPPPVVRTTSARKAKRPARIVARVPRTNYRTALLDQKCTQACGSDGKNYRVTSYTDGYNPKLRAIATPRIECGITGAPVCPSSPTKLLSASLVTD